MIASSCSTRPGENINKWAAVTTTLCFPILKYAPEPPTAAPPKSISTLTAASLDVFHAFRL